MFTILIGSRVYENIRRRNDAAFYSDTALGYISNKVRQSDSAGAVSIRSVDGCDVLVLSSGIEDTVYETWIYTKDGSLKELFSERGSGLTPEDGIDVMECSPVIFSVEETAAGQLITAALEADPSPRSVRLLLRSGSTKRVFSEAGAGAEAAAEPAAGPDGKEAIR